MAEILRNGMSCTVTITNAINTLYMGLYLVSELNKMMSYLQISDLKN